MQKLWVIYINKQCWEATMKLYYSICTAVKMHLEVVVQLQATNQKQLTMLFKGGLYNVLLKQSCIFLALFLEFLMHFFKQTNLHNKMHRYMHHNNKRKNKLT